ncbi:MAG TPA: hypothetical protein VJ276_26745, partial [Thermoanaerobaculia bacterium]|nr:hypothetical protein [Thermoanaerobaculia bacterium]
LPREGADVTTSRDGRWVVLLRESGRVEWHDLRDGRVASAEGVEAREGLAVAPDGTVALRPYTDLLMLHPRGAARARCSIGKPANQAIFSPDSSLLATWSSDDPSVRLWRAGDCRVVGVVPRKGQAPTAAFSSDGGSLLVSDDKVIRRWNIAARGFDAGLALDAPSATNIAADARFIATAHGDGIIRLTRAGGSTILLQGPHGHTTVRFLAFSPDGLWLASVGDDDRAVLWDLATSQPIGTPIDADQGQLRFVAFSDDSRTLLTFGTDGPPKRWDIDAVAWAEQACRVAQRNLTCGEWRRVFGAQPYRKTCPAFPGGC